MLESIFRSKINFQNTQSNKIWKKGGADIFIIFLMRDSLRITYFRGCRKKKGGEEKNEQIISVR